MENKINNEMPALIQDFLDYLQTIKNKADNTIESYGFDLVTFFKFTLHNKKLAKSVDEADINNIDEDLIREIKLADLYAFMTYCEKKGNVASTRARKVSCLQTYFKYLNTKAEIINSNPAKDLEKPSIEKREVVYLTLDECQKVLEHLDSAYQDKSNKYTYNYYRDKCMFVILLNTGLRLSELVNIKLSHIKNNDLTVIGKGNKQRTIPLNEACLKAINEYLSNRNEEKADSSSLEYLFLSSRQQPIGKRAVQRMVKKVIEDSNIINAKKYTPHKLRHTSATLLHKHSKVDIRTLQDMLGHVNISTTQIYTHVDNDTLRNAVNSNPLNI